ncbi:ribosome recycling factor [Aeromicrobium sp. CF4.19]|uniref:ribosome recycling factor n=1 Tax=Aeromicrobium sp. CF4.19 TaxID=3373082 RepID=UPI003EE4B041
MDKAVEHTREEFAAIRTGRAHPAMFAQITAEYYGTPTPLQQLAGFQVPEPRTVIISPFDDSAKPAIERAIRDSDLGVNPTDDGKVLRVSLPELTEERRKEYIKLARSKAEDGRVAVRGVRRGAKQALDKAEKDSEISKDENTGAEKRLDAQTKKHVEVIDEMLKNKEAELLAV